MTACGTPEYVAPEVLAQTGYSTSCDIWSLGIVVYVMLCGRPPFWSRNQQRLFKLIKNEPVKFPDRYFSGVSSDAKDLITKMLVKDPKNRLSAEQVLSHPWLGGDDTQVEARKQTDLKHTLTTLQTYCDSPDELPEHVGSNFD
eukprot:SAG31_NODE_3468_length_4238_cov_112.307321_4_plen_143_part_00